MLHLLILGLIIILGRLLPTTRWLSRGKDLFLWIYRLKIELTTHYFVIDGLLRFSCWHRIHWRAKSGSVRISRMFISVKGFRDKMLLLIYISLIWLLIPLIRGKPFLSLNLLDGVELLFIGLLSISSIGVEW